MPGAYLMGWDATNEKWVKCQVTADGKLIIDPTDIFENTPTDNQHGKAPDSDWAHDHAADENAHHTKTTSGEIDHGSVVGLADDDHTRYLDKDGSRALTDTWDIGSGKQIKGGGRYYNVLSYFINGTPTYGYKIKTNLPAVGVAHMHTIRIEGLVYDLRLSIGLLLSFYCYDNGFRDCSITAYGPWKPTVKVGNESNKVVIFIDAKEYYARFDVAYFSISLAPGADSLKGWSGADEAYAGDPSVTLGYKQPPTLGDYAAKAVDTEYQADTDGFVVACIYADNDGDWGRLNGYEGAASPATNERAACMVRYLAASDVRVQTASITFPVKKGNYWRVTATNITGTCTIYVNWVPMG